MQALGLLSLLIAIGFGVYFVSSDTKINEAGDTVGSTHESAINSAQEAVNQIESKSAGGAIDATDSGIFGGIGSVEVYDGISVKKSTTKLDLSGRNLSGSLKAEVRQLSNLRELNLSGNNFTGLPAEVGQLSQLRVLNLSNNPFTGLPNELGNLKNLEVLDVRGTDASEFDLNIIEGNLSSSVEILR